MSPKREIKIIVGPTASGKTALALRLAHGQPVSLISADSRQVYRGLSIVTGKDIPAGFVKEDGCYTDGIIRLFGLDLIDPDQSLNAAEYSAYARKIIAWETKASRQVIVVGGTGFYLKALTQPETLAGVAPNVGLRRRLGRLSPGELRRRLEELAPARLAAMNASDAANPRRLIRAIEIASAPAAVPATPTPVGESPSFSWIGLRLPLEQLRQRIKARVFARLAAGALAEVRQLRQNYPDRSLPIYSSLGLTPILKFLDGEIDRNKLVELWTNAEVSYAKRQLTWFAKQPPIIWYDEDEL